jgi:hypothetical protein
MSACDNSAGPKAETRPRKDRRRQGGSLKRVKNDLVPVTIYLSDQAGHVEVEAAVETLLTAAGLTIKAREDPVIGSWFRRLWARIVVAADTPEGKELSALVLHGLEAKTTLTWDADVTSKMLENLGPVLASLSGVEEAVLRLGAVLIVKVDATLGVYQLTAAQQLALDHAPGLAKSPKEIIAALTAEASQELSQTAGTPVAQTIAIPKGDLGIRVSGKSAKRSTAGDGSRH